MERRGPARRTSTSRDGCGEWLGLTPQDFEGYLFLNSGRPCRSSSRSKLKTAPRSRCPWSSGSLRPITDNRIDVMTVDPFVSSHRVTENDNNAIETVAKTSAGIADETRSAIDLVHHTRKTGGRETVVEDGRGGSALLYAARSARVLNGMTEAEAKRPQSMLTEAGSFSVSITARATLPRPRQPRGSTWPRLPLGMATTWA